MMSVPDHPEAASSGRWARHRAEIAQLGLAGWLRRNLFWLIAEWLGLRITWVALLPLQAPSRRPAVPLALDHRLAGRDTMLAASARPELRLDAAAVAARFDRGDLCLATSHTDRIIAYNWYATGNIGLPGGFVMRFPPGFVASHDTFVHPDWRGQGVAFDSWRVSRAIFGSRGATHILSWADAGNVASIRAVNKNEHTQWVGAVASWNALGRRAAFASPGCSRRGIHVTAPSAGGGTPSR